MTPRIFRTILHVADIDAAADFYHHLLATTGLRVSPGRHYIACGPVVLALLDPAKEEAHAPRPNSDNLYFATDDLEAVFNRAQHLNCLSPEEIHGAPAGRISLRPWGERSFYAIDPWGNQLCFVDETTLFTGQRAMFGWGDFSRRSLTPIAVRCPPTRNCFASSR